MLIKAQEFEQAVTLLAKAHQLDPSDIEVLNNYGFVLIRSRNLDKAWLALADTLAMKPDRDLAWLNLGDVLALQGKIDLAVAGFMNAYRFSKNQEKTHQSFQSLQSSEDSPYVREAIKKATEKATRIFSIKPPLKQPRIDATSIKSIIIWMAIIIVFGVFIHMARGFLINVVALLGGVYGIYYSLTSNSIRWGVFSLMASLIVGYNVFQVIVEGDFLKKIGSSASSCLSYLNSYNSTGQVSESIDNDSEVVQTQKAVIPSMVPNRLTDKKTQQIDNTMDASNNKTYQYDAFISYSRKDEIFARKLEKALEDYTPPKTINAPKRHLNIFRDEDDMVGTEYKRSIDRLMQESEKLIVICSPNSRNSEYVNDEIRRFVKYSNAENIIPIIIAGKPNNEVQDHQKAMEAFPEALLEVMEMPLAKDYRDFNISNDKIDKSPFEHAWYGLLSEIYGINRREMEERDKKKIVRLQAIKTGITLAFIVVSILTISFYVQKYIEQRISRSRELATQALNTLIIDPTLSFRLAETALHIKPTIESQIALFRVFDSESCFNSQIFEGHFALVLDASFSPDGKTIVTASHDMTARLWDTVTGKEFRRLEDDEFNHAAFSRDGTQIVTFARRNYDSALLLWDATTGMILQKWGKNAITEHVDSEIHQLIGYKPLDWAYFDKLSPDKSHRLEIRDNEVLLFDVKSDQVICHLVGHKDQVNSAKFSPDGSQIVTGSSDRTARLWHLPSPPKKNDRDPFIKPPLESSDTRFKYETHGDNSISVTDTFKKIKAQSQGKIIEILDVSSGKVKHTLVGHTGTVDKIIFSPDGKLLATACRVLIRNNVKVKLNL